MISRLNAPIKQIVRVEQENKTHSYVVYKKLTLNIKHKQNEMDGKMVSQGNDKDK